MDYRKNVMYVLLVHVPYLAFQACMAFAGLFGYNSMAGLACKLAHLGDTHNTTLGLGRAQEGRTRLWGGPQRVFTDKEL